MSMKLDLYNIKIHKKKFDLNKYWFAAVIESLFEVDKLETINEHYKSDYEGTDQGTVFHEKFYNEVGKFIDGGFFNIYKTALPLYNF